MNIQAWITFIVLGLGWFATIIMKFNDLRHLKIDFAKHEEKNDDHFKKIYEKIEGVFDRVSHLEGKLNNK